MIRLLRDHYTSNYVSYQAARPALGPKLASLQIHIQVHPALSMERMGHSVPRKSGCTMYNFRNECITSLCAAVPLFGTYLGKRIQLPPAAPVLEQSPNTVVWHRKYGAQEVGGSGRQWAVKEGQWLQGNILLITSCSQWRPCFSST